MPLTKERKAELLEEIQSTLERNSIVYLANTSGMTVAQSNELRRRFRAANIEFKVLKNTLVRLAMDRIGGYNDIYEQLNGPTGVAFSDEPSAPARVLRKFLDDHPTLERPEFKGAFVDGAVFGPGNLDVLTKLKSKQEILGDVIGLLLSPASNIVGAITNPGGTLVGALQEMAKREG